MLVVFPTYQGDIRSLFLLLRWIRRLGGAKTHHALICADAGTQWSDVMEAINLASESFAEVRITTNEESVVGWPKGPNSLFLAAATYINGHWPKPWLWMETDAVPLKAGWLDDLERAYSESRHMVMGVIVPRGTSDESLPEKHVTGTAVYPHHAVKFMAEHCGGDKAFDMAAAADLVPMTKETDLIQHFWGQKNLAPTFSEKRGPGMPVNTLVPSNISGRAVIFHRNPDGTLIRMLWKQQFPKDSQDRSVIVVLPYCHRDYALLARNLDWMRTMHGQVPFRAVVHTDDHTIAQFRGDIERRAQAVFAHVETSMYPAPRIERWPQAANWAFLKAAELASRSFQGPWLWLEADATPTKPDWITRLDAAYAICGKPFYGPIVPKLGHMNGVAIYPQDTVRRIPKALAQWEQNAWDSIMKPEMIRDCFDASELIQHVWGMVDGKPHAYSGNCISFRTQDMLKWLSPTAVLFHRCKDGSLIEQLRKRHEGQHTHRNPPQGQVVAGLVPAVH